MPWKGKQSKELKAFIQKNFPEYVDNRMQGKCVFCSKPIDIGDFRDELSLKEFHISGICQKCQDEVFGKDDN
jgi:hypothetical protein